MAMTEKDAAAHARDLARRIGDAEKSRSAGLEIAAQFNEGKLESLRLEHLRLTHKYGADHARVAEIAMRITVITEAQRELASDLQRSAIRAPRADRDAAAFHGRIVDAHGLGVAGLTVRARHAEEATVLAKEVTDDRGHFVLTIREQKAEQPEVPVVLEVLSGNHRIVHRDPEPHSIAAGSVTYTEIKLVDSDKHATAAASPSTEAAASSPSGAEGDSTGEDTAAPPRPRTPRVRRARKK